MSNPVDIKLTQFTNINEDGTPSNDITYGIRIYDNTGNDYMNHFDTFESFQEAIKPLSKIFDLIDCLRDPFYWKEAIIDEGGFLFNEKFVKVSKTLGILHIET